MAKVTKPKKEFWESKDKPKHLKIDRKIDEADEKPYNMSLRKDNNSKKKK